MRFLLAVVVLILMLFAPTYAQTPTAPTACPDAPAPCEVKTGGSYSLSFTHDGQNATGYRLYLRQASSATDAKVGNDILLSALQNGAVVVPLTAPATSGEYLITASAFNSVAETKSQPYSFKVLAAPNAPGNLRIYLVVSLAADGTAQFRIVDVQTTK